MLCALWPAASSAVELDDLRWPTVRSLEIRSDGDPDLAEIQELLAIEVGRPLRPADVQRSLVNLQVSGVASYAALYRRPVMESPEVAEPGIGEVEVILALWSSIRVEEVVIEGELGGLERKDLLAVLPQRAGGPLIESRLVRGVFRLQDLFEDRGYLRRRVVLMPEIDEKRKRARIVYRVEAGPRAEIAEIAYRGDLGPFEERDLTGHLRDKPGEPFRRQRLPDEADRLERWLIEQGHRQASVSDPEVTLDEDRTGARLVYPVRVGPLVPLEVHGVETKPLRRRSLLPFVDGQGYDEASLLLSADRLRTYFQGEGHYRVKVEFREEPREDGALVVHLDIEPGPKLTLQSVAFEGNETFSADRLSALIKTAPRNLLVLGSGRLVDSELEADLSNLRSFYALEGFGRVRVGPPVIDHRPDGDLELLIPIIEGSRTSVGELTFAGFEVVSPGELAGRLEVEDGGPFHPRRLRRSLAFIRQQYEQRGYERIQVSAEENWNEERSRVDLSFQIIEGPRTEVDRVVIRGNTRTKTAAIRRIAGLAPGDPASLSRLTEVERRLSRQGVFRRVEVERTPAPLGSSARDILIRVEEGRVRRIAYGAGYDSEAGFGALVSYLHSNLTGRLDSLALNARVQQENQEYSLFLDRPRVQRLPLTFSAFWVEEDLDLRLGDAEDFQLIRKGARVETYQDLTWGRVGLSAGYRKVENQIPADLLTETGEPFERADQTLRLTSLVASLQVDRRDDPLDPSRGWNSVLRLENAIPVSSLGTDADFLEVFAQQTYYYNLGSFGVLAGSVRLGGIEPFSAPDLEDPLIPPGLDLPSSQIFIAERFFAGGASTHRALRRDRLGIAGETLFPNEDGEFVPAGGNGLLLLNLDYRFPISGPLEGVVFVDSGNVWADWRDIDSSDLRTGAGVGLRYRSPIGPVRVEVGWPFERLPGDSVAAFSFGLGASF